MVHALRLELSSLGLRGRTSPAKTGLVMTLAFASFHTFPLVLTS